MAVPACVNCQVMRHCAEPIGLTRGLLVLPHRVLAILTKHIGITHSNRNGVYYQYGAMDADIRRSDNNGITLVETPSNPWCERSKRYTQTCIRKGLCRPKLSDEHECSIKGRL